MDSCGRMHREDTPVGREDDREENNYAFSCKIDEQFVEEMDIGKYETDIENVSEVKACIGIENVNTDECIIIEEIVTEYDWRHANDKVTMFEICLVEHEY